MTVKEFDKLISKITYKPFFSIECELRLDTDAVAVHISTWQPNVEDNGLLQYWNLIKSKYFAGVINTTNVREKYIKLSATHRIDLHYLKQLTEKEALAKIRQWLLFFEQHELDEWFKYKGKQVNNPHE